VVAGNEHDIIALGLDKEERRRLGVEIDDMGNMTYVRYNENSDI